MIKADSAKIVHAVGCIPEEAIHVQVNSMTPCWKNDGDAVFGQPPGEIMGLPDPTLEIRLIDHFEQPAGDDMMSRPLNPPYELLPNVRICFSFKRMPISS